MARETFTTAVPATLLYAAPRPRTACLLAPRSFGRAASSAGRAQPEVQELPRRRLIGSARAIGQRPVRAVAVAVAVVWLRRRSPGAIQPSAMRTSRRRLRFCEVSLFHQLRPAPCQRAAAASAADRRPQAGVHCMGSWSSCAAMSLFLL